MTAELGDTMLRIQRCYDRLVTAVYLECPGVSHYFDQTALREQVCRCFVSFLVKPSWDADAEELLYVAIDIGPASHYEWRGLPPGTYDPELLGGCCSIESGVGKDLSLMPIHLLPPVEAGRAFREAVDAFVTDAIDFLEEQQAFIFRYIHNAKPAEG